MTDAVLVLNGGSSSLKFAVFEEQGTLPLLLRGSVSSLARNPRLRTVATAAAAAVDKSLGDGPIAIADAFSAVASLLADRNLLGRIGKIGHRIVHGGQTFTHAVRLEAETVAVLRRLEPLAPIHQAVNLEIVTLAAELLPHAVQVGCFDTAILARRPMLIGSLPAKVASTRHSETVKP